MHVSNGATALLRPTSVATVKGGWRLGAMLALWLCWQMVASATGLVTVNIVAAGSGSGTITVNGTTATLPYSGQFMDFVQLEAIPGLNSSFVSWSGDQSSSTAQTFVQLFAWPMATFNLTVTFNSTGVVSISSPNCYVVAHSSVSPYYGHFGVSVKQTPTDLNWSLITYDQAGWSNGHAFRLDGDTPINLSTTAPTTASHVVNNTIVTQWIIGTTTITATQAIVDVGNGRLDTCQVTYHVTNGDAASHTVGIKSGWDTLIVDNDDARIATSTDSIVAVETGYGLTGEGGSYPQAIVPQRFYAFQYDTIATPGLVAQCTFPTLATPPDKLIIGQWSRVSSSSNFILQPSGLSYGDSAFAAWWLDRSLAPGASADYVVQYGLANSIGAAGQLALNVLAPANLQPNAQGTDYTSNPFPLQVVLQNTTGSRCYNTQLNITLPAGLSLVGSSSPFDIGTLAAGEVRTITFQVQVDLVQHPGPETLSYQVTGTGLMGNEVPQNVTANLSLTLGQLSNVRSIDQQLWAMGVNWYGELGLGDTTERHVPTLVLPRGPVGVAAGSHHSLVIKADGSLWGMGANESGQLGTNDVVERHQPVQIVAGSGPGGGVTVTGAAGGWAHSMWVKSNGSLWATGWNGLGQLGTGDMLDRQTPVSVLSSGVAAVSAGYGHTMILKTDGTLWTTGLNDYGQLGTGDTTNRSSPVQIDTGVTAIAAGAWHSLYVKSDGSLWGMGNNADGRLGIMQMYANVSYSTQFYGHGTIILYPTQIVGSGVVGAAGGGWHSLFWKTDGSLWAMGDNSQGQLGTGDTMGHYTPVQVLPNGVIMASAGFDFSLVVKQGGSLWGVGRNVFGALGTGTTATAAALTQIVPDGVVAVASGGAVAGAGGWHSLFIRNHYSQPRLVITASGNGHGTVTVDGTTVALPAGLTMTDMAQPLLRATAAPGSRFVGWTGSLTSSSNPVTVAMNGDQTICAVFTLDTYTVTFVAAGNGTVTPSSTTGVTYGTTVTASAIPNTHAHFVGWTDQNHAAVTLPYAVTGTATLTATFAPDVYTVYYLASGNGTVSPSGTQSVAYGTPVTPAALPASGYHLVCWMDQTPTTVTLPYTITGPTTLTAYFAQDTGPQVTVTYLAAGNGTVNPSGTRTVTSGTPVTASATPGAHQHLVDWTDQNQELVTFPYTVTVASTLTATFATDTYTVRVLSAGNGTVSPAGTVTVAYGATITASATPDSHYHFVEWRDQTNAVATLPYTVRGNTTLTAYFAQNPTDTVAVTYVAVGPGTVTPSGTMEVPYGTTTTPTALPDAHCHFVNWRDQNDAPVSFPLTLVTATTLTATFAVDMVSIYVFANGNGTVAPAGYTVVPYGTALSPVATPAPGFHFEWWMDDFSHYASVPYIATHDATLQAWFRADTVPVTYLSAGHGVVITGDWWAPLQAPVGSQVTPPVQPDANYHLAYWTDQNNQIVTLPYTIPGPTTLTAHFAANVITVICIAGGNGTVSPAGPFTVPYGTTVTPAVTPASHYHLRYWQNETGAVATLPYTVLGPTVLTANITIDTYPLFVRTVGNGTTTPAGTTTVAYGTPVSPVATPQDGNRFVGWTDQYSNGVTLPYTVTNATTLIATFAPIGVPTLLTPTGVQTTATPMFCWTAVPYATVYDLYVYDLTTGQAPVVRNATATGTTWTSTALAYGHSYRAYIRAGVAGLWSPWSTSLDFSTSDPLLPLLTAPVGAQPSPTPQFVWNTVNGALDYEIYLADATLSMALVVDQGGLTGSSWTPPALSFGHAYRAWIRARTGTTTYTEWTTAPVDFSIASLGVPQVTAPTTTVSTGTPTIMWTSVPFANVYDVYVVDVTANLSPVVRNTAATGTSWTTGTLPYGHQYTVYVRAGVSGAATQWSAWSSGQNFATSDPLIPALTAPLGTQSTATPLFVWTPVAAGLDYEIYVADQTLAGAQALYPTGLTGNQWMPGTALHFGHAYRAYVRARTGSSTYTAWSPVPLDFTVAPLGIPVVTGPVGVQSSSSVTITWTAVTSATTYDVYLADVTSGLVLVSRNTAVSGTQWQPPALSYGHSYRIWVRAQSGSDFSDWSASRDFSVAALTPPTLTGPNGLQASSTAAITWTGVAAATAYDVYVADVTLTQVLAERNTAATGTSWTPAAFVPGHAYRVWARSLNGSDFSDWSASLDFSVVGLTVPALTGPVGVQGGATPTFTWGAVANATAYELWVNDLTSGPNPAIHQTTLTGTNWVSTPLVVGHTYQGYIRALAGGATSAWSASTDFSIASAGALAAVAPLPPPSTLSPAGTISDRQPMFTWQVTQGADHYDLQLEDLTVMYTGININTRLSQVTQWQVNQLLPQGHTYRWRIRACTRSDNGPWATWQCFTVQ